MSEPKLARVLGEAIALHKSGQLLHAAALYRKVLAQAPYHILTWRYLGAALAQSGDLHQAAQMMQEAIQKTGPNPDLCNDLGAIFLTQGRLSEAITSFKIAHDLDPQNINILLNLARTHIQAKRSKEAQNVLAKILDLDPHFSLAHFEMGQAYISDNDFRCALESFRMALKYAPEFAEAQAMIGNILLKLGENESAVAAYAAALRLQPNLPGGHYNLALAEIVCRRPEQAVTALKQALTLNPHSAEIYSLLSQASLEAYDLDEAINAGRTALKIDKDFIPAMINLGNALRDRGDHQKALDLYLNALHFEPQNLGLLFNLGNAYRGLGDMTKAEFYYRQVLALEPNHSDTKWQLGLLFLMQGYFDKGWPLYEERWHRPEFASLRQKHSLPYWHGENLNNGILLLWTEQGLGDSIQFVRLTAQARKLCGKIIVQCPLSLAWLLKTAPGIDLVIGPNDPLPPAAAQASLMSLPAILKITDPSTVTSVPYLQAPQESIQKWKERLEKFPRPWIGVSWQGSLRNRMDRHRSIPLRNFAPLAQSKGTLISLQKIFGLEQIATCGFQDRLIQFDDIDTGDTAFFDTAGIIKNLDVVITSDTAIAHLGGALGQLTWVGLQAIPDWRWLLQRSDCPWYPTMRLFRQSTPNDWMTVVHAMAQEINHLD
ncbi:MAG: tetratricopeptide repeat protein [Alphaproteobacteria bacterium]